MIYYKSLLTWDARAYLKFWMYSGICPSAFKWEIQSDENKKLTHSLHCWLSVLHLQRIKTEGKFS